MTKGKVLAGERERASRKSGIRLAQADLGRFYLPTGSSRARICQIESSENVSDRVAEKYRIALEMAVRWRRRMLAIAKQAERETAALMAAPGPEV